LGSSSEWFKNPTFRFCFTTLTKPRFARGSKAHALRVLCVFYLFSKAEHAEQAEHASGARKTHANSSFARVSKTTLCSTL